MSEKFGLDTAGNELMSPFYTDSEEISKLS